MGCVLLLGAFSGDLKQKGTSFLFFISRAQSRQFNMSVMLLGHCMRGALNPKPQLFCLGIAQGGALSGEVNRC